VVALSAIAFKMDSLRIGPMITPLSSRRVQKVARETVTLDHLSNGRLTLDVGLGNPDDLRLYGPWPRKCDGSGKRQIRLGEMRDWRRDPYGERSRVTGKAQKSHGGGQNEHSELSKAMAATVMVQGRNWPRCGLDPAPAGSLRCPLVDMTTRRARRGTPYPKLMAVESGIDLKGPDDGVWAANGPSRLVRSRPTGSWARHDQPPDSLPAPGTTSRSWQEPGRWCRGGSRLVWSAAAWRCPSGPGVEAFPGCRS
jgi:Luciferase-like monooxygenase